MKTYFVQQDKWRNVRLAITVGGQVRNLVNENSDENLLFWIKMGPTAPVPGQRVKYSAKNSWNHFKVNFRFLCNIAIICRGFHYPHRQKRRWLRSPDTARYLVCLAASDADSWGRTHQHQHQHQLGEVTHVWQSSVKQKYVLIKVYGDMSPPPPQYHPSTHAHEAICETSSGNNFNFCIQPPHQKSVIGRCNDNHYCPVFAKLCCTDWWHN